ncbi:electron transport complex subunit RsxB [Rhodoferax saidenbachensis]|uniref:Electron transport complex protein RnfB n=1 Tax=Rhodoferax saidenbachensis TaxID=1484693 RepID=A0ABU1ZV67_9BURK|nr:electron transport complex subunit RsxB [Rhodoferax saidenbachensis]MDR7308446.1 electron transport complex protein RnfB [Rhodoferax saidenbachensis]
MTAGTTAAPALVQRLLDALPQTQCTRCGYPDCAGYAQAVAAGEAGINQCPPGGAEGIRRLAALTGQPIVPLDPAFGVEGPRSVVFIDENWCIGCTLCIAACPTDAIIGSNKRMHTVQEQHCTGCELCLPVCPVDCILLENVSGTQTGWNAWSQPLADHARTRYSASQTRRTREEAEQAQRLQDKAEMKLADLPAHSQHTDPAVLDKKRAVIEAALARARAKQTPKPS